MKAERILRLIERAREPLLKEAHIKAYAQAMIERDRERVIDECTKYKEWECSCMAGGHGYIEADRNKIKSLPIILE